jgi:hypothetical protein
MEGAVSERKKVIVVGNPEMDSRMREVFMRGVPAGKRTATEQSILEPMSFTFRTDEHGNRIPTRGLIWPT